MLVLFDIHRPRSFPHFSLSLLLPEPPVSGFLRLPSPRCCPEAPGWPRRRRCAPARTRWSRFSLHQEPSVPANPLSAASLPAGLLSRGTSASEPAPAQPLRSGRPAQGPPWRGGAGRAGGGPLGPRAFRAGGRRRRPVPAAGAGVALPCPPWRSCGPWGRWAPSGWPWCSGLSWCPRRWASRWASPRPTCGCWWRRWR